MKIETLTDGRIAIDGGPLRRPEMANYVALTPEEQRELLEELARHLGATVTFPEPAVPTESAWVVIPQAPGIPVSEDDRRRTGYNMLPCKLEVAQAVAGQARDSEIFLAIASITDAFRVACEEHTGPPAYIIDHGNGAYSVIV